MKTFNRRVSRSSTQISAVPFFERTIIEIDAEVATHRQPNPFYIRNLLQNLIIDLGRVCNSNCAWLPAEYMEVKTFIEEEFRSPLSLEYLAKRVGRSPQRFAVQFKKIFGIPPVEYVIRLRLAEAFAMLQNRNLSVKDVAAGTGFESVQYFCRIFRQRFGISPGKTRIPAPK